MTFQVNNYIGKRQCGELIAALQDAKIEDSSAKYHSFLGSRVIISSRALYQIAGSEVRSSLDRLHRDLVKTVNARVEDEQELHLEYSIFTEMHKGDGHRLHADNEKELSDGSWVANHTPYRHFTTMLYLNSSGVDYTGGELSFPGLNQTIVPTAGLLIGFFCDRRYVHEVRVVREGVRFALSAWYTRDKERLQKLSRDGAVPEY